MEYSNCDIAADLSSILCSEEEILMELHNLNCAKATGPDGISYICSHVERDCRNCMSTNKKSIQSANQATYSMEMLFQSLTTYQIKPHLQTIDLFHCYQVLCKTNVLNHIGSCWGTFSNFVTTVELPTREVNLNCAGCYCPHLAELSWYWKGCFLRLQESFWLSSA